MRFSEKRKNVDIKLKALFINGFRWSEWQDLPFASASPCILMARWPSPSDTVPVSPLLAKNSPQDCFLNAQTLSGLNPFKIESKKRAAYATLFNLVGVAGFEPTASWSRTKHATICATPRQRLNIIYYNPDKIKCFFKKIQVFLELTVNCGKGNAVTVQAVVFLPFVTLVCFCKCTAIRV